MFGAHEILFVKIVVAQNGQEEGPNTFRSDIALIQAAPPFKLLLAMEYETCRLNKKKLVTTPKFETLDIFLITAPALSKQSHTLNGTSGSDEFCCPLVLVEQFLACRKKESGNCTGFCHLLHQIHKNYCASSHPYDQYQQ